MSQPAPHAPSPVDDLCTRAREALRDRAFDTALGLYREALRIDGLNLAANEGLALACALSSDFEGAAAGLERLLQIAPPKGATLLNLGTIYCRLERFDQAVECLQKAIAKDRSSGRAFLNLGLAHRRLSRPAMALSAYREAIRLDPTMIEAHLGLAGVFVELRNPQQALVQYLKVLEMRPDHAAAEEGRRAALRLLEQAERDAGPFGRLVNPEDYLGRRLDDRVRVLSDEERRLDRENLREFCTAIGNVSRHLANHLRDRVRPRLVAVQTLLATGREFTPEFRELHFELERDVRAADELGHVLRERMVLLRAHDELMRRPAE